MKLLKKITLTFILLIFILIGQDIYAMSQKEAGETIAQFAINFFDNYASETIYSVAGWTDNYRGQRTIAYITGQKTSGVAEPSSGMKASGMKAKEFTNKYAFDCVGFVSFCIHHSLAIGASNVFTCFVTPQSGASNGFYKVTDGSRQPGDILATGGHVAVYIGNRVRN